jgi:uncharacterized membrane protein HdeD (DUF308 family)
VLRGYVVGFYVISFLLILGVIATIPSAFWTANNAWEEDIFAWDILIGLCGVLLAYWVFKDEEDVKNLEMPLYRRNTVLGAEYPQMQLFRSSRIKGSV